MNRTSLTSYQLSDLFDFAASSDRENSHSTLDRVMTVAGTAFIFFTWSATAAVLLGLNIVVLSVSGTAIGILAGLVIAASFKTNTLAPLPLLIPHGTVNDRMRPPPILAMQERNVEQIAQILSDRFKPEAQNSNLSDENLDQILQEVDLLLEKVKTEAQRDLVLDEQLIEGRFNINRVLEPLSPERQKERRAELQKIINQAYVNREFKQKTRLTTGESDERTLLSYLKFDVSDNSNYQNKDLVYEILQNIISTQLQKDFPTASLSEVKQKLKQCAFKARLKAAGLVTPLQVEKFHMLYSHFQSFKKESSEQLQTVELPLPADFSLHETSLAVRSLKKSFESLKSDYTYHVLKKFFTHHQIEAKFGNENVALNDLNNFITRNKFRFNPDQLRIEYLETLTALDKSPLAQKIAFYKKWGSYLKAEMIQGFEDASEALGEGVCWAVCQRIRFKGQTHPNMTYKELAQEIKLIPADRYHQGAYTIKFHFKCENQSKQTKIPAFIKKEGFDEKRLFSFDYDANEPLLRNYFNEHKDQLAHSAGWLELILTIEDKENTQAHAILMRWDTAKNCYWIVDPNVGLLCFENEHGPEEAQKACLNCFKDLLITYYPLTYNLQGNQLVKT